MSEYVATPAINIGITADGRLHIDTEDARYLLSVHEGPAALPTLRLEKVPVSVAPIL